jgi:hypothetical protein
MMVNHRIDIETDLIRVFDLAENLPGHIRMGFSRRGLHLGVDAESHVRVLAPWFRSLARNDSFPRWRYRSDKHSLENSLSEPQTAPAGLLKKLSLSSALEVELRSQWNPPRIERDSRHLQLMHNYQLYRSAN